jgi:hypothetical protein
VTNPAVQHTVNGAVVAAPIVSAWANFPAVVTVVLGCLGILYYLIVIIEKIAGWRAQWLQIRSSSRTVVQRLQDEKPPEAPL